MNGQGMGSALAVRTTPSSRVPLTPGHVPGEKGRTAVSIHAIIAGSADEVWALLKTFSGVMEYLPGIVANSVTGSGVGSLRTMLLANGEKVVARVDEVKETSPRAVRYSTLVSPLPVEGHVAMLQVWEIDSSRCRLSWSGTFSARDVSNQEAIGSVRKVYGNALLRLQRLFGAHQPAEGQFGPLPVSGGTDGA